MTTPFFTANETAWIDPFLDEVKDRLCVGRRDQKALLLDHQRALRYYLDQGLSPEICRARLAPQNLGDFYKQPPTAWYPLDVAAKVYPLRVNLSRMNVYRVSCELTKPLVPALLQMALTYTIKRFPCFATTLKNGVFWHYLDSVNSRFPIYEETQRPCKPIGIAASKAPSFRVLYFHNRISVEFFHALTDGTGASIFLSTLVHTYLALMGVNAPVHAGMKDIHEAPKEGEWIDHFPLCDKGRKGSTFGDRPALQMKGGFALRQPCEVIYFDLQTDLLLQKARSLGVTITTLLLAYLLLACKEAVPQERTKRKIQIQLPINMRKYYETCTLRNFSMFTPIRFSLEEITTTQALLPHIAKQVKEGTSKDAVDVGAQSARDLVRSLRFVPLVLKRPIAHLITPYLGDRLFTTTFSNVGIIHLPEAFAPHVEKFFFTIGPSIYSRAMCCMCTTGNHAVLSVTKATMNPSFENALHALLEKEGLIARIEGSAFHG